MYDIGLGSVVTQNHFYSLNRIWHNIEREDWLRVYKIYFPYVPKVNITRELKLTVFKNWQDFPFSLISSIQNNLWQSEFDFPVHRYTNIHLLRLLQLSESFEQIKWSIEWWNGQLETAFLFYFQNLKLQKQIIDGIGYQIRMNNTANKQKVWREINPLLSSWQNKNKY